MLYDKLKNYSQCGIYPFHMPGHKRVDITGNGTIPYNIDLTEIYGFDNLHSPEGIIKAVHDKAKLLYGVKNSFMLVNGATGGILAVIRSLTSYGDKVLVARNCHKSVYNAIELCGLDAKYIMPGIDQNFGIFSSIKPSDIENELKNNSDIKVLIITSPTYEGIVSDIKAISDICHNHNAKLFVDESHGAHFPFDDYFPIEATKCGADVAVVSLHKTLPSLTQTALLLTNDDELSRAIADNLSVFETSSPSYILMSSIEQCLDYLKNSGQAFYEYKNNLQAFFKACKNLRKIKILSAENFSTDAFDIDKSKIVISSDKTDINGIELAKILREKYRIETEMAYTSYIIAMTSVCDTRQGFEMLKNALFEINEECNAVNSENSLSSYTDKLPQKVFKASEKHKYKSEIKKFDLSKDSASLEYVWAYPPGIPLVVPGEIISEEIINQITYLKKSGIEIFSTHKKMPDYITVTEL